MIEQKSLVELACEEIKHAIATGAFAAGERILEAQVSERLGISRPPLREALRILAAQHILEMTPRRGYRVIGLSDADADEVYSVRIVLEQFALEAILPKLETLDLEPLRDAVKRMWVAAESQNESAVVRTNVDFHVALVALSGNMRLTQCYRTLMEPMQLYMARNITAEARTRGGLVEGCVRHQDLLSAFEARDGERVAAAVREHGERRYLGAGATADTQH